MKVKEELKTFTDDAYTKALKMVSVVEEIMRDPTSVEDKSKELDMLARDIIATQETIKELAYMLRRGKERVSTVSHDGR